MLNSNQTILYHWAGSSVFTTPLAGILYIIFQKKAPEPPVELKNGGLSKNKNQTTTFDLYMKAIEERGLPIGPYQDFLDYLEHQPDPFIQNEAITLTKESMVTASIDLFKQFKLMQFLANHQEMIFPIKSWAACTFCDYQDLCELRCNQENWQILAKSEYIPNKRYAKKEASNDER